MNRVQTANQSSEMQIPGVYPSVGLEQASRNDLHMRILRNAQRNAYALTDEHFMAIDSVVAMHAAHNCSTTRFMQEQSLFRLFAGQGGARYLCDLFRIERATELLPEIYRLAGIAEEF